MLRSCSHGINLSGFCRAEGAIALLLNPTIRHENIREAIAKGRADPLQPAAQSCYTAWKSSSRSQTAPGDTIRDSWGETQVICCYGEPCLINAWISYTDYQNIILPSLFLQLSFLQTPQERVQCAPLASPWHPVFLWAHPCQHGLWNILRTNIAGTINPLLDSKSWPWAFSVSFCLFFVPCPGKLFQSFYNASIVHDHDKYLV